MGLIIYGMKDGEDLFGFHQHSELVTDRQGKTIPNPHYVRGAGFELSAGEFSTLCELLDLPNRTDRFAPQFMLDACDAALADLGGKAARAGLSTANINAWADRIRELREVAALSLSCGADQICAH